MRDGIEHDEEKGYGKTGGNKRVQDGQDRRWCVRVELDHPLRELAADCSVGRKI